MASQHPLALYLQAFDEAHDFIEELQRDLQVLEKEHDDFLRNLLAGQGTSSAATQVLNDTVFLNSKLTAAIKAKGRLRATMAKFVKAAQPTGAAVASATATATVGLADTSTGQVPLSLDVFQENYRQARDQLQAEFLKQQSLAQDAPTQEDRLKADEVATELQNKLKELRDEKDAFLTNVALTGNAAVGPRDDVVSATIKLNDDLAKVIVDANRPRTMLTIVTSFLGGAIHVFNGSVPPAPTPPPASEP